MYDELNEIFDRLWPLCRSITGPEIDRSLRIISEYIPLSIREIPTGQKVFDWTVPQEWELISASLHTEEGDLVFSSDDSNLHVLNFSDPYSGIICFDELDSHLYSQPELPEAIPYVTSYYNNRWGLCISDKQRKRLRKDVNYRVNIDVRKFDGFLRYGEAFLQGYSDETVLITSYLCHPSMANNELSGPLALVGLYSKLSQLKNRYYSYRFLVWPETIGSIAYLATAQESHLKSVVAGFVLTCMGGPSKKISFKHSRRDWLGCSESVDTLVDSFCLQDSDGFTSREFSPVGGSDERQLCSPGINLPVVQVARTVYGEYDQYHTSLDTKEFMRVSSVVDSVEQLFLFMRAFEINRFPLYSSVVGGEPMLGRRGLYPTVNSPLAKTMSSDGTFDARKSLDSLLCVLSLIDGSHRLIDIANFLGYSYRSLVPVLEYLIQESLIGVSDGDMSYYR